MTWTRLRTRRRGLSLPAAIVLLPLAHAACTATLPAPEAMTTAALPDGDAAALTRWIQDGCRELRTRTSCRETALIRIAETRGIDVAMDALAALAVPDGEGHGLSHMIGIRGYQAAGAGVADAFARCTPIHQSGCYHGVIQAYFGELSGVGAGALDTETMDGLCAPYRGPEGDRWLLFQCLHGAGHGVMLVHGNHLPRALEACDLLSSGWDREACYGGAFMESAMTVIAPHHAHVAHVAGDDAAGAATGAAHHHAHQHGHHNDHEPEPEPFPAVDPSDLHHPCSALDDRYALACYDMQTAVMLHLLDRDVAAAAAACREAPTPLLRAVCHRSLGRDINAMTEGDHARSAALCARAAAQDRPACHTGVVKNVIDVTADAQSGVPYCALTPAGPERQGCYRAIGEQTAMLLPAPEDRARFCRGLAGGDVVACLEGAGAG